MNDIVKVPDAESLKDRKDAVVLEVGIGEITYMIATALMQQGAIEKGAMQNTTGATFGEINREKDTIELIMFGREDYKQEDFNIPLAEVPPAAAG